MGPTQGQQQDEFEAVKMQSGCTAPYCHILLC